MLNDKKNVAIYSFSTGKFLNIRKYACVKDLTNIMSAHVVHQDYFGHFQKLV